MPPYAWELKTGVQNTNMYTNVYNTIIHNTSLWLKAKESAHNIEDPDSILVWEDPWEAGNSKLT